MTAPSYRSTLRTYLSPLAGRVVVLALALLGSIALQLVVPLLLREFIDAALAEAVVSSLVTIGVLVCSARRMKPRPKRSSR